MNEVADLPDDVEVLKAKIAALEEQIRKLEHNVEIFRRIAFGRGSEKRGKRKLPPDAAGMHQGHLFLVHLLEEAERTAAKTDAHGTIEITATRPQRTPSKRRQKMPSHLPKIRTTYELSGEQCVCECGGEMHAIGEDVRSELERIELTVVHEIARKRYACRKCANGVKTAPGPDRVIDKGLLSTGFLAHVIAERFLLHLP
jgi:transposase